MHRKKQFFTLAVLISLVWLVAAQAIAAPPAPWANLLQNPRFEQGLEGWTSWYYEDIVMNKDKGQTASPDLQLSLYQPYFMVSEHKWDRETRGKGEDTAAAGAVSGRHYTRFRAGFFQSVYVAPGSRVGFTVWVNGFCEDEGQGKCPVLLRAGIDPYGGTDWRSPNIQWVDVQVSDQQYKMLITPQVQVPDGRVTVFLWGEPRYPVLYNAAYFDDATLVVTVPPTPTGAAPTAPPPSPTPASCAQMRFESDVTMPDNSSVTASAHFVKTWRIQNSGTCAWSGTLNFVGTGDQMNGPSPMTLPSIDVGQSMDVSITLTAPAQPGAYQGTWQVRTSDGASLGPLVVKVNVASATTTPMPTLTVAPPEQISSPTPSNMVSIGPNGSVNNKGPLAATPDGLTRNGTGSDAMSGSVPVGLSDNDGRVGLIVSAVVTLVGLAFVVGFVWWNRR